MQPPPEIRTFQPSFNSLYLNSLEVLNPSESRQRASSLVLPFTLTLPLKASTSVLSCTNLHQAKQYYFLVHIFKMRSGLGLVFLLLAQILVLQATVDGSESAGLRSLELKTETAVQPHGETDKTADQPVSGVAESSEAAEAPDIRRLGKHHSTDKSVAGGGVIIGGLVTAIFAAVVCYIRVTRKRDSHH